MRNTEKLLTSRGFKTAPLQSAWVKDKIPMTDEQLVEDILMLTPGEKIVRGADVYRAIMKKVWWLYPFFLLSLVPGLNYIFNWSYKTFNKNRHLISKTCQLGDQ